MSCRECGGPGTLYVQQAYVDRQAPQLPPDDPEYQKREAKRAALANTVFPCPSCRPEQFQAWSAGQDRLRPPASPEPQLAPQHEDDDWTRSRRDLA